MNSDVCRVISEFCDVRLRAAFALTNSTLLSLLPTPHEVSRYVVVESDGMVERTFGIASFIRRCVAMNLEPKTFAYAIVTFIRTKFEDKLSQKSTIGGTKSASCDTSRRCVTAVGNLYVHRQWKVIGELVRLHFPVNFYGYGTMDLENMSPKEGIKCLLESQTDPCIRFRLANICAKLGIRARTILLRMGQPWIPVPHCAPSKRAQKLFSTLTGDDAKVTNWCLKSICEGYEYVSDINITLYENLRTEIDTYATKYAGPGQRVPCHLFLLRVFVLGEDICDPNSSLPI